MPRFPPDNDQIADIAVCQFGATIWLVSPSNFVLHKPGLQNGWQRELKSGPG
jgi:hypothetical protein